MTPRILIAGIGNIFLGDDAFGSEVAQRLLRMSWPDHVRVRDFGIRGLDLSYALMDGWDAAILLDAVPRGGAPGTLYVIEPDACAENVLPEAHALDPKKVLALVRSMDCAPEKVLILGCEPSPLAPDEELMGLSDAVTAAVEEAVRMTTELVEQITKEWSKKESKHEQISESSRDWRGGDRRHHNAAGY